MIAGHGIDLQEIAAVERAYQKHETFARRILTEREWQLFDQLSSAKRQMAFLAGRWAAKEAFSKAVGTGIGQLGFQDIEILPDNQGAPKVTQSPWEGAVFVSISHSGGFAQASVILEK